jgi:hypothetical protein
MLSPAAEDVEVLVDPFHGGEVCFLEDAADKLARVHGLKVRVCCCLTVASGMKWLAMSSAAIPILLLLPLLCSGFVPRNTMVEYVIRCAQHVSPSMSACSLARSSSTLPSYATSRPMPSRPASFW